MRPKRKKSLPSARRESDAGGCSGTEEPGHPSRAPRRAADVLRNANVARAYLGRTRTPSVTSDAPPFVEAANTPRLLAAFDQLVGPGRWYPRPHVGTFPIRFPSAENPGDAGWHIDGSYRVGDQLYDSSLSRP
jgi:hypothetical protein